MFPPSANPGDSAGNHENADDSILPAPPPKATAEHQPLTRVMALHAVAYCERLFYLEEVEEIRLADERVEAGRLLHQQLPDDQPFTSYTMESEELGIRGRFDAVKRLDGQWVVVEHKRGRSRKGPDGNPDAWDSDRVQVIAYALLLAQRLGIAAGDVLGQVRYHADRRTVDVPIDEVAQVEFDRVMYRCNELRRTAQRPPPTTAANRCLHCSLAPVCLPEEERIARDPAWDTLRLFPPDDERLTLHILEHGDRVSRAGERITVWNVIGQKIADHPIAELGQVILHGNSQVTTQALQLCFANRVQVHWLSPGGRYLGGTAAGTGGVQRRLRQYEALGQPALRLNLARRLVTTKVRDQLRHLLRVARQEHRRTPAIDAAITHIRQQIARVPSAPDEDFLRGLEGDSAESYWSAFPDLLLPEVDSLWRTKGRSRRPPKDAGNALLSFLYSVLYRDCMVAILAVGLEPSFGFFHTPRSAAYPLAEDVMELFRVSLVDLPVVASLNRRQWKPEHVRDLGPGGWLLSDSGRRLAIHLYEERKREMWKHPVTGYSLSYARLIELEVRLLEKEYTGTPGLFAQRNLR